MADLSEEEYNDIHVAHKVFCRITNKLIHSPIDLSEFVDNLERHELIGGEMRRSATDPETSREKGFEMVMHPLKTQIMNRPGTFEKLLQTISACQLHGDLVETLKHSYLSGKLNWELWCPVQLSKQTAPILLG